jgi:hypothetical protein
MEFLEGATIGDADIPPDTEVCSGRLRQSGRSIQNDRTPRQTKKKPATIMDVLCKAIRPFCLGEFNVFR